MKQEKRLTIRLPKDLHDQFKAAAAGNGKDMTEVILEFVKNYVSIHTALPFTQMRPTGN